MTNKKLTLFLPLLIVAIVITIFLMALNSKNENNQVIIKPKPFPQFALTELQSGKSLSEKIFTSSSNNKYTLLNVWASWCSVCKTEHPFLLKLAEQGINITGLNYRDDPQAAKSLLHKSGDPYQQIIVDDKGKLALDLGVIGTPESYLIDNQGMIVARVNGVLNQTVWEKRFLPVITDNGVE
ncbi:MAG: DsbE family thiol:disulfide interchange protein [Psychromonas sp.]|nr:DsbE family thiol:disulfide interchange protein [Psychromonas sp.]